MKPNATLTVMSLLSILLFSIHVTDDVVRGMDSWGPDKLSFVLILVVWLYGTLVLGERRSGLVIILLGGVFTALMPVIHLRMRADLAKSSGAFFFIWTLIALGTTGTFSAILAARGLRLLTKGADAANGGNDEEASGGPPRAAALVGPA